MRTLALLFAFILGCGPLWAAQNQADEPYVPRLVVVIDDLGYNRERGDAALALPGAVTYAVLPFTPYATHFAEAAHAKGREVMLHMPMANTREKALGPAALTAGMSRMAAKKELLAALDAVPHVQGVNNHMGSLLTSQNQPMEWVMEVLKARQLYFIDSLTAADSVAWSTARDRGIPYLKRHIFLDHLAEPEFIAAQFERGIRIARDYGFAVMIGHPYPETTAYLQQALPALSEAGIRLVPASAIVQPEVKQRLTALARKHPQLADAAQPEKTHP